MLIADSCPRVDDDPCRGSILILPSIGYTHEGARREPRCDAIAGCDGFHGVCRPSIPEGVLQLNELTYPFAWLGILAEVAPSTEEPIDAPHQRGFAWTASAPRSSAGSTSNATPAIGSRSGRSSGFRRGAPSSIGL